MANQQLALFERHDSGSSVEELAHPSGYVGLQAFHKYWGKKPLEPLLFLIDHLSEPGGLVVDPFVGSGSSGVAATRLHRKFIGIDLNPVAVRLSTLLVSPPPVDDIKIAFRQLETIAKSPILATYHCPLIGRAITHYLWEGNKLRDMWVMGRGTGRREVAPSELDRTLAANYEGYESTRIRKPRFFTNSRINAVASMTLTDVFTGRAVHNIDVLLSAIDAVPARSRPAMLLALTAAAGQMSKMVFAITGRGKKEGRSQSNTEVGSWVIGFWRPNVHFEVNVWNCLEIRVRKLIRALEELEEQERVSVGNIDAVLTGKAQCALVTGDALAVLDVIPDGSADLVLTDPPHSDREPYLELSEIWNCILGADVDFASEVVVSNAKERHKTRTEYVVRMRKLLDQGSRKLTPTGSLALMFNARDKSSWEVVQELEGATQSGLTYLGCFPLRYSATSVVQDNRKGALKTDYVLVYSRSTSVIPQLTGIGGWNTSMPRLRE
ncbi:MAG: DNA methyltransferase [Dehalococcoidia bacterium]|nr:DNA methyltransferase [Dehalococcoidia bacterium]